MNRQNTMIPSRYRHLTAIQKPTKKSHTACWILYCRIMRSRLHGRPILEAYNLWRECFRLMPALSSIETMSADHVRRAIGFSRNATHRRTWGSHLACHDRYDGLRIWPEANISTRHRIFTISVLILHSTTPLVVPPTSAEHRSC